MLWRLTLCLFVSVPTGTPQNITTDSDVEYVDIFFKVTIITIYYFLFVVKKFRGCKSFPSFPEKYLWLC